MDTTKPFGEKYLSGHSNERLLEQYRDEVDVVLDFLDPPLEKGAKVLDFPCGKGIQAQLLARKGFDVTGIDGNAEAVQYAQQNQRGPRFQVADFKELSGEKLLKNESFDAVLCLDRSFGYFPTVKENEELLKDYYTKLKSGGRLVIQWLFNPQVHAADVRNPSEVLPAGQTEDHPTVPKRYFSRRDWTKVEDRLPPDYPLDPAYESFRDLWIDHYALIKDNGETDEDSRSKRADYLLVADDKNPVLKERKPVDAPVMRALARHAGLPEPQFVYKHLPEEHLSYCAVVFTKPASSATHRIQRGALQGVKDILRTSENPGRK